MSVKATVTRYQYGYSVQLDLGNLDDDTIEYALERYRVLLDAVDKLPQPVAKKKKGEE